MEIQTIKDNALVRLKTLLGIKDDEQNSLLSFLIDDTIDMILGYCRIDVLPRQLESLVPIISADMYRAKGYGQLEAPEIVKSISQGDRSVSYADTNPDNDFLSSYYERLNPFRCRRGRVPSEVESI
ncbi:MAG: phage head-tail connector protein [Clostridia bacterium]|nr:phage head-tail connector protein [Clostridia bacterium]